MGLSFSLEMESNPTPNLVSMSAKSHALLRQPPAILVDLITSALVSPMAFLTLSRESRSSSSEG